MTTKEKDKLQFNVHGSPANIFNFALLWKSMSLRHRMHSHEIRFLGDYRLALYGRYVDYVYDYDYEFVAEGKCHLRLIQQANAEITQLVEQSEICRRHSFNQCHVSVLKKTRYHDATASITSPQQLPATVSVFSDKVCRLVAGMEQLTGRPLDSRGTWCGAAGQVRWGRDQQQQSDLTGWGRNKQWLTSDEHCVISFPSH
ncbi:hypothetical protein CBL_00570 [Carabus blaptoides fortunei]